jgi:hypothetical protein
MMPAGIAALALALATTQTFPLPTTFDETAARTFYGFVQTFHRKLGGPFLVSRPELVNFLVGQNSEIEGYGFAHLASHHAPAARDVLASLEQARYTLVVETWLLPQQPEWQSALRRNYRPLGACRLSSYSTGYDARLCARRGLPVEFTPPTGVRCLAAPHGHWASRRPWITGRLASPPWSHAPARNGWCHEAENWQLGKPVSQKWHSSALERHTQEPFSS